jgi:hypothetical protein
MAAKKRTASPAQLRALARGRAKLKLARKRGTVTKKKAAPKRKTARQKNPAIPRGLMRTRALTSDIKAGTTRARKTNPPHYVIRLANAARYFDGAGWTTKSGAAQYMTKAKASAIGTKVANASNKAVYVEAV